MTPWGGRDPRRWQREAIGAVRASILSGIRAPIVHACTGAGKVSGDPGRLLARRLPPVPPLAEVLGAAPVAVQAGLASRVVLLDLVDGRLVERAP